MPPVPKSSISPCDLVEPVVARLYGQDAIAEIEKTSLGKITSFKDGKTLKQREQFVHRSGDKILLTEDEQRRVDAEKKIQSALSKGQLVASVKSVSAGELTVPPEYWKDKDRWMTLYTGFLDAPLDRCTDTEGQPVYLDEQAAMAWVEALPAAGASESTARGIDADDQPRSAQFVAWEIEQHTLRFPKNAKRPAMTLRKAANTIAIRIGLDLAYVERETRRARREREKRELKSGESGDA